MNAISTIRNRLDELLWQVYAEDISLAESSYAALIQDADGSYYWPDIDYADQTRSLWQPVNHYNRILSILRFYGKDRLLQDTDYASRMIGALRYWLSRKFTNPNWWHNEIGMPRSLGDIALMMEPVLDEADFKTVCDLILRGSFAYGFDQYFSKWTGTNLLWGAYNTIKHALLTRDEHWLRFAVDKVADEICFDCEEGFQSDGSFFQHGPRLYSGGYGTSFAGDISIFTYLLQQTPYQFSQEKLHIVLTHVLDGTRHMIQGGTRDWICIGRIIAHPRGHDALDNLSYLNRFLNTYEMPRKDEIAQYMAFLRGEAEFISTRYFPRAAYLCHHTNGLYVGAKFHNDYTLNAEHCNGEGILCYNMSYGTYTCIMRDGGEYDHLMAVWDYSRIPGTTARTETDEQLLAHDTSWEHYTMTNSDFGGMQKDDMAVIYELARHDGVQASCADFAIPGGFVCLGSGICVTDGRDEALVTTVDQSLLRGKVSYEGESVIMNGIRYTPLNGTVFSLFAGLRTGSWHRNHPSDSAEPVQKPVFQLTIEHAAGSIGSYAYMISPADRPAPKVEILRNDPKCQSICANGHVLTADHAEGARIEPASY